MNGGPDWAVAILSQFTWKWFNSVFLCPTGGLFPTGSHEYEVFRFALSQHQDVPKLVPQVDMVDTASSFSMTYACK